MRFIDRMFGALRRNADLVLLFLVLAAAQPLVPAGHPLTRPDLTPWLMLSLSLATLLRGRAIGDGPHPMLSRRENSLAITIRRLGQATLPWALLLWAETGRTRSPIALGLSVLLTAIAAWFLWSSRSEGITAWSPPGVADGLVTTLAALLAVGGAIGIGRWQGLLDGLPYLTWLAPPALLGLGFLSIGASGGHLRNIRQRVRAGRRDGGRYIPSTFRPLLALIGPSVGLWILLVLALGPSIEPTAFSASFVASLHVVIWAGVIWPPPVPVAMACLLHEVVPAGGKDKAKADTASSFHQPPAGALRLQPLYIRRTRAVHPWLVPVRGSRISEFDDPVRALWTEPPTPRAAHVLGAAAFELDPRTGQTQTDTITLKIKNRQDVTDLTESDVQTRRIWVLKAFPGAGESRRGVLSTYRWDRSVPESTLQVVNAATESVTLTSGSILVLSSEGVARAFELEIGTPIQAWEQQPGFRPPQLEDYTQP